MSPKSVAILIFISAITRQGVAAPIAQSPTRPTPFKPDFEPRVVERGPNYRVWERIAIDTSPQGRTYESKHHYTEVASGLCYQKENSWIDADPQIVIGDDGSALGQNTQTLAQFQPDINSDGSVLVTTKSGKQIRSHVLGICYHDWKSQQSVQVGSIKSTVGNITRKTQLVYSNAFDGVTADVLYDYKQAGLSQNIVFRTQLPTLPAEMNRGSTRVEIWTEFLDPPPALIKSVPEPKSAETFQLEINFGDVRIGRGTAFKTTGKHRQPGGIPVKKQWLQIQGRTFLIESVPYNTILRQTLDLPPPPQASLDADKFPTITPALRHPPARRVGDATSRKKIQVAAVDQQPPGFVLDYEIVSDTDGEIVFRGDTTYYVSDTVWAGSITIEGNSVIKFAPGVSGINVSGTESCPSGVKCLTAPYRPAVFTSQEDDSVGEPISYSSGNPLPYTDCVGLNMISDSPTDLHDLRFSFLYGPISANHGLTATSVQFGHCPVPISTDGDWPVWIRNCLFDTFDTMLDGHELNAPNVYIENVTAANGSNVFSAEFGPIQNASLWGYNSIFANVTQLCPANLVNGIRGSHNAFYNAPTFGSAQQNLNTNPFQSAGAGNFYLANPGLRDAGTVVDIDPTLVDVLKTKTTYPPVVHVSEVIDGATPYIVIALRDLTQGNADTPDIGYHYDPIDYVFADCEALSDVTFTAGTAAAWYRVNSGFGESGRGILLDDLASCTFAGTFDKPCYWVRANTVQEGSAGEPFSYGNGGITGRSTTGDPNISPEVHLTFTKCSEMASESSGFFADAGGYTKVFAKHSELYSGYITGYGISVAMTNCLLHESVIGNSEGYTGNFVYLRSCTFANGGGLLLTSWYQQPDFFVEDCIFDGTDIQQEELGWNGTFDYNAYQQSARVLLIGMDTRQTPPHDKTETVNWRAGPSGSFYLPTGSALIDTGSRPAMDAGLYHFTTRSDETKEGNTQVDIGYHYVTASAENVALDSNGDGLPDYLVDVNGNGLEDPMETPWARPAIVSQPVSVAATAPGGTAIFTVVAKGIPTLTYQWQRNGATLVNTDNIKGARSSSLTISSISASNAGAYSVRVSNPYGTVASIPAQLLFGSQSQSQSSWIGPATHIWRPQLGGGVWFQERSVINGIGPAITEYPRPLLVGLRGDKAEQGYRFDLDPTGNGGRTAFANPMAVSDPASEEYVLKKLEETHNVEFMWSMPLPSSYSTDPYDTNAPAGAGYPWQTPEYYAAYLQYLTEPATMTQQELDGLQLPAAGVLPVVDTNGAVIVANEQLIRTNWGNLRAKRGLHPLPYTIQFVVLGVEPSGGAQEDYATGAAYGTNALAAQVAIRSRSSQFTSAYPGRTSVLAAMPLGLYAGNDHPLDDRSHDSWFYPMLDAIRNGRTIAEFDALGFSYLDIHHYYVNNAADTPEDNARFFPIMINNREINCGLNNCYPGWQYYWSSAPFPWPGGVDFTKRLWMYEDAVYALNDYTDGNGQYERFNRWNLGCSEHGLRNLSSSENDMGAGLHWALYLAEVMRYNATWDLNWVLCEQGYASAQLHFKNGYLTRTPGHYAYKMAQEFYGYEYRDNTFPGPNDPSVGYSVGDGDPGNYLASNVVVRVFRNPADDHYHLFIINKANDAYTIPASDFGGGTIVKWTQIQNDNINASNPIGAPQPANAIATRDVTSAYVQGSPIVIPRFSINHIELVALGTVIVATPTSNWATTTSMLTPRAVATAVTLSDGQILALGGLGVPTAGPTETVLSSTEVYDPTTETWTTRAPISTPRTGCSVTLLNDGRVLVAGGNSSTRTLASCALYDPTTDSWSTTSAMAAPRSFHTAIILQNGKVLVIGGTTSDTSGPDAEIYDPAGGTWSAASTALWMRHRNSHTATLLNNGKVLIAGGYFATSQNVYSLSPSASLYDPTTDSWTITGSMATSRFGHVAALLTNGKVLVAGGSDAYFSGNAVSGAELYDPATGQWSSAGAMINPAYRGSTATMLMDGTVLVAGGWTESGATAAASIYNPDANYWSVISPMPAPRANHFATLLSDGNVLIAGGLNDTAWSANSYFSSAIIYEPPRNLNFTHTGNTITLSWSTNYVGFKLQMSNDLKPTSWIDSPAVPTINGSYFTVTQLISGTRFFRLHH